MRCSLRCLVASLVLCAASPAASQPRHLTLQQAFAQATKTNPTLQVLRERVAQAEAAYYKAWSALKPTASFQGTFTHYDIAIVFDPARSLGVTVPGFQAIEIQKQNQFAFNLGANLPLFRGPAYPRLGVARQGVDVARLREVRSRQDFLLRVAQAYYLVVSRAEAVKAVETKVTLDRKHLAAAKAQLELGQASRTTVLRADLVATQDEQSLRSQRIALDAARRQLAILIGVSGSPDVERPAEPATPTGSEGEQVRDAMAQRVDLRAADISLQMAERTVSSVWWGFAPTLDLSWAYRWTEAQGFANQRGSWNLLLALNMPIYDGGVRYADLRDSRSKVIEARAQRRALGLEIESDIVRLRAEVESADTGVVSARKAVSLARATVEDMEASFEVGAATQLDVLDASQRRLDAELQLTSSLYSRDLARLSLAHALGRFGPGRT
jgi:outer membrane protein TolC